MIALAPLLALALSACAPAPPKAEDLVPLVWPEAPNKPRVAFVRQFSRPDDFGITKGFLQRLSEFLFGGSESRLIRPMAVLAANGVVYVADPGASGVHRFDTESREYALIRADKEMSLPSPVGLARGKEGEVYVTDSDLGKVFVIRPGAKAAVPLALPEMGQPTGIAFDPVSRRLYVVDTKAHRVNVFGPDGALESSIGTRGVGDGEMNYPTLVWRDRGGRLYVTDSLNFRIQIFDAEGRFLGKFGRAGDGGGDNMRPKGVASDSYGHVYVADSLLNALQIFDRAGRYLLSVGGLGPDRGEFWLPAGIFISDDDTIYVADSYNQRVQVFRYIGGPT